MHSLPDSELAVLRPLTDRFPNVDAAMSEIARLSAVLTLPKGTIHIISDIPARTRSCGMSSTMRPARCDPWPKRCLPDVWLLKNSRSS